MGYSVFKGACTSSALGGERSILLSYRRICMNYLIFMQFRRSNLLYLGGERSILLSYGNLCKVYSVFIHLRRRNPSRLGGVRSILLSYGCSLCLFASNPSGLGGGPYPGGCEDSLFYVAALMYRLDPGFFPPLFSRTGLKNHRRASCCPAVPCYFTDKHKKSQTSVSYALQRRGYTPTS